MRISWFGILVMSVSSMAELGGKFLPIPVAFSSPETGPGGGAKLRWQDPFDKPGFADITAYTTIKAQSHVDAEVLRDSLWGGWRLDGYIEAGKFPALWFGEGNPPADSLGSVYTPLYYGGWFTVSKWLAGGWLLGSKLFVENWDITNDGKGIHRTDRFRGEDGGLEANIGMELVHEGRDLPENPREGSYLKLGLQTSIPGTDFSWQDLTIDQSFATTISDFTSVVRARHEEVWGSLPFWRTPFLGNRKFLRGLPDKRLRGNAAQCVGTEFRWHGPKIWFTTIQPAVFGELGRAGGHSEVWSADVNWAAGGGVRFPLAGGKAVLRADYGWSEVGSGLYVDFGQAF